MSGHAVSAVRLVGLFWAQSRLELALPIATAIAAPLTLAYVASRLGGDPHELAALAITTAFVMPVTRAGIGVLDDRSFGRFLLLGTVCSDRPAYLLARVGLAVAETLLVVAAAIAILGSLGLVPLSGQALAAGCGVALACAPGLAALGATAAGRAANRESGWGAINILGLGLLLASPVLYSLEALPAGLRQLAWLSPYTHVFPQVRAALAAGEWPVLHTAAAVALSGALGVAAYRSLPWWRS